METNKSPSKPYNLEPNIEAALSYLIPLIMGIFVFLMEKENKFVRFHAFQSILFGAAIFVVAAIIDWLPYFLGFVRPLIGLVFFGAWLYIMWEAYNDKETELPVIGKISKDQVNK